MNDNFKKIKRRALIVRLLKSLLAGVAVALPIVGVLLLLERFEQLALGTSKAIVIGGLAGLLVAAVVFLLLHLGDKRIAIALDRKYGLKEKVQTMLAFKEVQDDPMIDLQRRDANQALESAARSVPGIGKLWIYVLCLLVGAAVFVLSLFFNPVPPPEPEPEPEVPYAVEEIDLAALQQLIDSVAASEMESPYRENVVEALETLYEEIQTVTTVKAKDELVAEVMDEILQHTDDSSVGVEIITSLGQTGGKTLSLLAKALNYYEWPSDDPWSTFVEKIADFREGLNHADARDEHPDYDLMAEETKTLYLALKQNIALALQISEAPEDDELAVALDRLANLKLENEDGTRIYGFAVLAEYIQENGYTAAQRELDSTMTALNGEVFRALSQSNVNTDTGENAVTVLSNLFDVKAPSFERPVISEYSSGNSGGESGEGGVSGGISGGPTYGSDDKVYDPFTNRYVEYGTILDKYYAIMFGNITDGNYTEQEKKALEEYFKILYGGFEDEDGQN